ncbi:hypothetical protein K2B09_003068 [Salmonella enterica subsp. enterica]|nr:hypothetical protein [Salmonella enterica subsp. enterica]EHW9181820.1 hypothetical protein [Salmonella enterica subsp. enterica]
METTTTTPTITITTGESLDGATGSTSTPSIKSGYIPTDGSHGTIAKQIGTGEQAKDSFVWMTLKYCFGMAFVFSVCLMLVYFHFSFDNCEPEKIDIISDLKDIWSIFTPIVTLALGYAFGKREKE